ncbi:hypothetical protein SAMN06264364_102195 [Quadrisphaera granulorum]|uniref:Antitoxin n=2 Tax=Quadrisphaera granulorum TaxID=317664 RepID=A0A316AEP0_9ACTN|nr:hypothetical protein BXY45_102195 [Quadrisphaera granulorum]SZE95326.1 hypothetical protein SAMN06264364_102195 [Quadrisphaera granulorum]
MAERGLTFKDAINTAIVNGSRPREVRPYRTPTFDMGGPARVNLDRALALAGDLEDEEIIRKMERGA